MLALYIHIPFCREVCPYCDFHKIKLGSGTVPEKEYLRTLLAELRQAVEKYSLNGRQAPSLFFGGGTPSLMTPKFFETSLAEVRQTFQTSDDFEITVETNPEHASLEMFSAWRALGIHRVSFGVQSFQEDLLKKLGRRHDALRAIEAIRLAQKAGMENISLDLIFGAEGQTLESCRADLYKAMELNPTHISAYQLTVEPGTLLHSRIKEGATVLPQEETLVEMHRLVTQTLEEGGWGRYEISNYAKPGFESRHNLQYWRYGDYLGLGSGAVSFLAVRPELATQWLVEGQNEIKYICGLTGSPRTIYGKRWRTTRKLQQYLSGEILYEEEETIDNKTARGEFCMMGFRLIEGIESARFSSLFGVSFPEAYPHLYVDLLKKGWLVEQEGRLRLTEDGLIFSNAVARELF